MSSIAIANSTLQRQSSIGNGKQINMPRAKPTFLTLMLGLVLAQLAVLAKDFDFSFDPHELECPGNVTHEKVMLTAYRPQFDGASKRDFTDLKFKKLYTLQDFLDNRAPYVTVGMDPRLKIPYGQPICIPELNLHFRRNVKLQVRDTHEDLAGGGFRRVDICVRTQADSFDDIVNLLEATVVM